MKRKVYGSKNDYEMIIDPDSYRAYQAPQPVHYNAGIGRGKIKAGVYMQPNGTPIMVMPLLASGKAPVIQQNTPVVTAKNKR